MCKAKGKGPRCSSHARASLDKTWERHCQEPTSQTTEALEQAKRQFLLTPAGIASLREQEKHELASRLEIKRQHLTAEESRFAKYSTSVDGVSERWLGDKNLRPDLRNAVVAKAYALAVSAHRNVDRKSGEPYINHPLRTAKRLERLGYNHEVIAAALLHDAVEDSDMTLGDLRRHGFSDRIVEAVDSVTKRPGEEYVAAVLRASQNAIGQLVKLSDNLDNSSPEQLKPFNEEKRQKQIRKYSPARGVLVRAIYGLGTYVQGATVDGIVLRPNSRNAA